MSITIYEDPLSSELVSVEVTFATALAEAPSSAVAWLTRHGVTTEYPATLQAGATTTAATAVFDPSSRVTEGGKSAYVLTIQFRNGAGARIGRSLPIVLDVLTYPPAPA